MPEVAAAFDKVRQADVSLPHGWWEKVRRAVP